MAFSAADVKNLREMTGVGMMDCKKALTAADGDIDKAVEWLREKGLAAAQKKAGRIAAEGMAYAAVVDGIGVIVEVNAESDFVAKNDLFVDYVKGVAAVVAKENPADLDALYACAYGNGKTVLEEQNDKVLVIGASIGHVSPEAASGGPIGLVEEGDIIHIDIPNASITLEVSDEVLAERKAKYVAPEPNIKTGWLSRYARNVASANLGAVMK